MKIQFLGTAASPSIPVPSCQCDICMIAYKVKGKNLRRRSSLKVNEEMIIDIGPDIMSSSFAYDISLSDITICLQTHYHEDHFDPEMIISRHNEYSTVVNGDLIIAGSMPTLLMMDGIISRRCDYGSIFDDKVQSGLRIRLLPIVQFASYNIGHYNVIGYPANHGSKEDGCLIYSVEHDNHCLFYGTDTSILFDTVWEYLFNQDMKFDIVVLDHTYGFGYESKPFDHLAMKDFINHAKRFNDCFLKDSGTIYATHLSHEGNPEHTKLEEYVEKYGYRIAYDGLTVSLK